MDGVKHNEGKLPIYTVLKEQFPDAFLKVVERSLLGHEKYEKGNDWSNFRRLPNAYNEFSNALGRHLLEEGEDSQLDHHIAVAWNALARLQLFIENENKNKT